MGSDIVVSEKLHGPFSTLKIVLSGGLVNYCAPSRDNYEWENYALSKLEKRQVRNKSGVMSKLGTRNEGTRQELVRYTGGQLTCHRVMNYAAFH